VFKAKQKNVSERRSANRLHELLYRAFAYDKRIRIFSADWSPCTITAVNELESVQRMSTERFGMRTLSYESQLQCYTVHGS